jgi:endonuclease-8
MPEGDTIFRTAESVRRWINGRTVTAARTTAPVPVRLLVGSDVTAVEARAKHLLFRFSNGLVLHTHMRMTGSWHVYPTGDRWQRPRSQARLVLECGDRTSVCFNAPVIELLDPQQEATHASLVGLGPDVLDGSFDMDEVVRRARRCPPETTAGELLLDQRVVSGIGNIYRCESLFLEGLDPWATVGSIGDDRLRHLVAGACRIMRANVAAQTTMTRQFGAGGPWVYRQSGRPCRRCGTTIRASRLGEQGRSIFWCPTCQPPGG